jgi:hypothetical protein
MSAAGLAGAAMQPNLGQLFAKFLECRGLEPFEPTVEEVLPHQAAALVAVDPRGALLEAVEVAEYLVDAKSAVRLQLASLKAPPAWATLIRGHEEMFAVPLCLANFPQMLRDVTPFLESTRLSSLRPKASRSMDVDEVSEWGRKMLAKGRMAEALFATAVLRVARQFETAEGLLKQIEADWTDAPAGLLLNERAALAWQRGQVEEARALWSKHPHQANPAVLFNRGMAALFADQPREAAALLVKAIAGLPEKSAWHHLARLYLVTAGNAAAA